MGGQINPLGRKEIIFKWHVLRICNLMTFTGNMKCSFSPIVGVICILEFSKIFKFKPRPQKREKIDFQILEI